MKVTIRGLIFVAMLGLTAVSMWTTYVSLHDSVMPEPVIRIPLGGFGTWECSVFALVLSVAIGLMLFGLKLAIIDEQKRLSITGLVGLTIVAFISISFNMDVLYRTADREFFIRYSSAKVKEVYTDYLSDAQRDLEERRMELAKQVARQEGELEAEIQGLRDAPEGYGPRARKEDYELMLVEKETAVELDSVDKAMEARKEADALLATAFPESLAEIAQLQDEVRVAAKDVGAAVGLPLPRAVRMETPLFAVFSKLFDLRTVGMKEVFMLMLALFLDLGDIVGYSLVPDRPPKRKKPDITPLPDLPNYLPGTNPDTGGSAQLDIEPMAELMRDEKPPSGARLSFRRRRKRSY